MTKKLRFGAAAALLVGLAAVFLAWPSGPAYQGRSIDQWFYQPRNLADPPDAEQEREAFRAMGAAAVPFLVRRLEAAPSPRWKGLLASVSSSAGEIYRQRKEMWQSRAAHLLGEIGPGARSAETNLVRAAASGNWSLRGAATIALTKIRDEPLVPLIEKLKDTSDEQAWYENAMMVGEFGGRAEPAIPILLEALQNTNNIIQAHALIALGMIGREPDRCIPAVVPFLASPNVSDRQKALGALLAFGSNALVARKEIQALFTDPDPWTRMTANNGMKRLTSLEGTKSSGGTNR